MIGSSCGKKKAVLTDQLLVGMIGMQYVHSSLLEFEISISSQCNRQQFDDDDGDHKEVAWLDQNDPRNVNGPAIWTNISQKQCNLLGSHP